MKTAITLTVAAASVITLTVTNGQPAFLEACTALQGLGGVDQLDVSEMEPGLYCFDDAISGMKFVRLIADTAPVELPAGVFLPATSYNPAAPKYWATR